MKPDDILQLAARAQELGIQSINFVGDNWSLQIQFWPRPKYEPGAPQPAAVRPPPPTRIVTPELAEAARRQK